MIYEKWKKKLDEDGNPIIENGEYVMELVESGHYYSHETVQEYIAYLIEKIDENTSNSIVQNGFEFGGQRFSMSFNAQINWSNLLNIPDALFPLPISTKDDKVIMLDKANKLNFYLTELNAKNTELQAGTVKKQQAKLLTTLQECEDFESKL